MSRGDRVRIQSCFIRNSALYGLSLGACLLWTEAASAEVTLLEKDGWSFFSDGRINTFASLGFGDDFPTPTPNPVVGGAPHTLVGESALGAAGQNTEQDDANNKYFAIRGRNGFVASVLGFGVRRNITDSTVAKGFVGLWGHAESNLRRREQFPLIDVREGYVNFDGPWGSLTAGRQLGLFGRTSTEIDFLYGHNYGLGYPCGDGQGPTCGHIGTGVMFPGFAAGFMYSTPSLAGLKFHLGVYDPVRLLGAWDRAPIARPEVAATFERKFSESFFLKAGLEGMVQPLGRVEGFADGRQIDHSDTVWGAAGGARIEAGPLRLGAAVFRGKGLGQYYALQNSPVVFNPATVEIRSFTGMYAQTALVFGKAQISAGAGRVSIDQLEADKSDFTLSNAKSQMGISAAFYYRVSDSVVLGLDYFRFQTDWYGAPASGPGPDGTPVAIGGYLAGEKQVVNYINAGATFHW
jgi:hypothetical protein